MEFFEPHVKFPEKLSQDQQMLLYDPQTSGGLLFSVAAENADQCESDASQTGIPLWRVGEVTKTGIIEII